MNYKNFTEIKSKIARGESTVQQVVNHYLEQIASKNKALNIFLEVFDDEARKRAAEVDAKIQAGKAGRLAGMVISIKDNICYAGHKVSAASKILSGFESQFTATALQRLLDEDVIVIGRTNCDEFAMGSSNENSAFGSVKNPLDESRVTGGSSGGSAASVIANMCTASLGSDTGGSIRQPASFCNLVGFKPTYGRISRYGLIAYASSFDQIGPFAHDVEDAALLYEVMAGLDPRDATSLSSPVIPMDKGKPGKRVGLVKQAIEHEGNDPKIKRYYQKLEGQLKEEGYSIEWVDFNLLEYLVPIYYIITTAEASSNLARFDGIHYGYRHPDAQGIDEIYTKSRSTGFGKEVKRRILLGTFVLSAGYYDSYFGKAQKIRKLVKEETEKLLQKVDFLLLPTTPSGAFKLGENTADPIKMYLQDIYTVQANISGKPAISLPLMTDSQNLPLGIQVIADSNKEAELFSFSRILTDFQLSNALS